MDFLQLIHSVKAVKLISGQDGIIHVSIQSVSLHPNDESITVNA